MLSEQWDGAASCCGIALNFAVTKQFCVGAHGCRGRCACIESFQQIHNPASHAATFDTMSSECRPREPIECSPLMQVVAWAAFPCGGVHNVEQL